MKKAILVSLVILLVLIVLAPTQALAQRNYEVITVKGLEANNGVVILTVQEGSTGFRLQCNAKSVCSAQFGMYLAEKPKVTLEEALPIAIKAAQAKVPDLDKFVLHSVKARALKHDPKGQHWQFLWQELPFKTHLRGIIVRVYMKDGSTSVTEFQE
jgi:hypothetical protein